ncbi:MAG: alpha/beta hydrolase [Pseudomonadota bacterium]
MAALAAGRTGARTIAFPTGAHIHVTDTGDGVATVFLHGIGGNGGQWAPILSKLTSAGRLIAWDARCYGQSDGPPPSNFSAFADDLLALLDALQLKRILAVGHSMGGRILIEAALRAPERFGALFLSGTQPAYLAHMSEADRAAYVSARETLFEAGRVPPQKAEKVARSVLAPGTGAPAIKRLADDFVRLRPEGYLAALKVSFGWDRRADLAALKMPVRVVSGALDTVCPAAETLALADAVGDPSPVLLRGVGHMPQIEAPQVFAELVGAFIAEHSPPLQSGEVAR